MLFWQVPHPLVSVHNDRFMEYNKWHEMKTQAVYSSETLLPRPHVTVA
jgi:hypothetical protein